MNMNIGSTVTSALLLLLCVFAINSHSASEKTRDRNFAKGRCSMNEMIVLQTRWKWLMTETSVAEKTALFSAVIDYIRQHNSAKAGYLTQKHSSAPEPVSLMAYRLFTDIDMYINAYTNVNTYISHVEHLALTRSVWTKKIVDNIDILFEAIVQVVGRLIVSPDEKTTWTVCMEHMAYLTKAIVQDVELQATCNIDVTSGDPNFLISGTISFTQPAVGGPTRVSVDLSGFPEAGNKHGIHVHEGGSIDDRCMRAALHFNPHQQQHGGPEDTNRHVGDLGNIKVNTDGRVYYTLVDEHLSLIGKNNIVGRTVVIHTLEDDLGRGGYADSKVTGHAGGRVACCVIHRVYE